MIPRPARFATIVVLVLVVGGCGGDAKRATPEASAEKPNTFALQEWAVLAPTNTLKAGTVELTAVNTGHETHELVIVRAAESGDLPTKADGSVDEDKIPESQKVGEISELQAGRSATKAFELVAGDYVALCNLVDQMGTDSMNGMGGMMNHVHYQLGMATRFSVVS